MRIAAQFIGQISALQHDGLKARDDARGNKVRPITSR